LINVALRRGLWAGLCSPTIERAVVLGPIKAKPFGWPRRGASLDRPARVGGEI